MASNERIFECAGLRRTSNVEITTDVEVLSRHKTVRIREKGKEHNRRQGQETNSVPSQDKAIQCLVYRG
jgi:hypothetical protein